MIVVRAPGATSMIELLGHDLAEDAVRYSDAEPMEQRGKQARIAAIGIVVDSDAVVGMRGGIGGNAGIELDDFGGDIGGMVRHQPDFATSAAWRLLKIRVQGEKLRRT